MKLVSREPDAAEVIDLMPQAAGQAVAKSGPKADFLDVMTATVQEVSSLPNWNPREIARNKRMMDVDSPPGWNPVDYVPEEDYPLMTNAWSEIYKARNFTELNEVTRRVKAGAKRQDLMIDGGWAKFWGYTVGILSSPEYWPGLLWNPTGGVVRTGIELSGISAAETAAQELSMHQLQPGRDPYQSFENIGTGFLFGAIAGPVIGKFVKTSRFVPDSYGNKIDPIKVADEIGVEVHDISKNFGYRDADTIPDMIDSQIPLFDEVGGSGGAAARGHGADEKVIREMRWKSGMLSALRPLIKARSAVAHGVLNKFFGHDYQTKFNTKAVKVWDAEQGKMVETGEKEHWAKNTALSRAVDREASVFYVKGELALREGFMEWLGYEGKSMTVARMKNRGKWDEFSKEVRYASSIDDTSHASANPIVAKTAERVRNEVYAPIEKMGREVEMLDKKAKDGLRKTLQQAQKDLGKAKEAPEIAQAEAKIAKAQNALDEFDNLTGDVKYADWYANRRYNRAVIEEKSEIFKALATDAFGEGRIATAIKNIVDKETDNIVRLQGRIAKKQATLQKAIDKAQKDVDSKLAPPKAKRGPGAEAETAAVKQWQKDLKVAQGKLKTASTRLKTDKYLTQWGDEIVASEEKIALADTTVRTEGLDATVMSEIASDVDATYKKILNGEMTGDVFNQRTSTGSPFKERTLAIPDELLLKHGFLQTDMLDQIRGYVNSTLRPIRMKQTAGDLEMTGEFKKIEEDYALRAKNAGSKKEADSLLAEGDQVIETMQLVKDRYYGRSKMYKGQAATVANTARAIRNWNVMRMMGGVLITSMNDVARLNVAKIFTPELRGAGPGMLAAYKTVRAMDDAFRAAGIAHETISQIRLTRFVDMAQPLLSGNKGSQRFLNYTSKGAKALMKATALAEWTDYMKMMAAAMSQNQMVKMMRGYSKLTPKNKTILAEMGIDEAFSKAVMKEFDLGNAEMLNKHASSMNWDKWSDQAAAERMKDVLFRQSERILVTPRETDLPIFADNELGRAFLQFKSFSLAAHNQITVPMLERAKVGDLNAAYALGWMGAGGLVTEVSKMYVAGRQDELEDYTAGDWALAVADRSGAIPALSMWFNNIDLALGNRITAEMNAAPASRYSERSALGVLGPSASTIGDFLRMSAGIAGDGLDKRDARSMRRIAPFQNFAPLMPMANAAEDYLARNLPKPQKRKRKKK